MCNCYHFTQLLKIISRIVALFLVTSFYTNAQDSTKGNLSSSVNKIRESALKNTSAEACKCIDKIDAREKSPKEISKEIKACIDKHITSYQLVMKIAGIMPTDLNEVGVKKNNQDSSKKNNRPLS